MKKIKLNRNVILSVLLFLGIVFSIFQIAKSAVTNPGHGWGDIGDNSGDALPANRGGTGQITLTNNSVLVGNGTDVVKYVAPGTSGNLLQSNGTAWLSTAGLTVAQGGTGQTTFVANSVLLGNVAGAIANVAPGTSGNLLTSNGATWLSTALSGLTVAQGGTGLANLTANSVLVGNNTGAVTFVAPGTSGNVLSSNGTAWLSTTAAGGLSSGALLLRSVKTANGSITTSANTGNILIQLVGGGGGGGGANGANNNNGAVGGGGGSSGYTEAFLVVSPSTLYNFIIGAGGAAGATNAAGGVGGTSSFVVGANNVTAIGGNGGGAGVAGNTFLITLGGNGGAAATVGNLLTVGTGGGWARRDNNSAMLSGNGAPSHFGGGASGRNANGAGIAGGNFGGGGSGGFSRNSSTVTGGAGGQGVIIIWEYK